VHLEDSLISERGDLEQLSSAVAMTAPNTTAKKARKHSNKGRSGKKKCAAANSIPCLLQGKVGKEIWKEGVHFGQVRVPSLMLAIQDLSDWNEDTLYSFAIPPLHKLRQAFTLCIMDTI